MTTRNWVRTGVVLMLAVLAALPATAGDSIRVGDFYKAIAKFRNVPAGDGAAAERALRAQGVRLPGLDLLAALTEGDMVRISEAMGIRVKTQHPEAPVTASLVSGYTRTFGSELSSGGMPNPPTNPLGNGEGQNGNGQGQNGNGQGQNGHARSPSSPY